MLDIQGLKEIIEIAIDRELPDLPLDIDLYEELGMDSIGAVAMIVEIQRRVRIRVDENEVPKLRTPALLLEYVNSRFRRSPELTADKAAR